MHGSLEISAAGISQGNPAHLRRHLSASSPSWRQWTPNCMEARRSRELRRAPRGVGGTVLSLRRVRFAAAELGGKLMMHADAWRALFRATMAMLLGWHVLLPGSALAAEAVTYLFP